MALNPRTRGPRRVLLSFVVLILALGGLVVGAHLWGSGQLTPKLGLDLEGGTEMVLEPVLSDSTATVNQGQLDQARDIIQQRVDANGVAEAMVTTQGGRNIVVSIPGQPTADQLQAIRKPSRLRFRAVLEAGAGQPTPTSTTTATATGTSTVKPSATATTSSPAFTPAAGNTLSGSPALVPPALRADTTTPSTSPTGPVTTATAPSTSTSTSASTSGGSTSTPTAKPTSASDLAWVTPALQAEFSYKNTMEVPKIEKISLNMGVGEATQNAKLIDGAVAEMASIAGQKPVVTKARKAIAGFKIREQQAIGTMVTLRGARMYEFLDRFVTVALPRVRDFRGISGRSFDGRGNYNVGVKEQIIFPEIEYDKVDALRGLNISITTTAKTDAEAKALLAAFRFPFKN